MRCQQVLECLEDVGTVSLPDAVRQHVRKCRACETYVRDWVLVRAGLRSLAREAAPELSVGFAARLVRRLDEIGEIGRSGEEFLERTGRRFVYASLLLALTVLLVLLAPISGPLRAPSTADSYLAEPEAFNSVGDPVLSGDPASQIPALPGSAPFRGGRPE